MIDVEYAQSSNSSRTRDLPHCFATVIPASVEQRRTHGWLFALADQVDKNGENRDKSALALETVSSGFRSASPYELHRALLPRLIQQTNAKLLQDPKGQSSTAFL